MRYSRANRRGDGPEQQEVTGGSQVELDGLAQEAEQRSHVLLEGLRRQTGGQEQERWR